MLKGTEKASFVCFGLLFAALLLCVGLSAAQSFAHTPDYTLVSPSADDYLRAVPPIIASQAFNPDRSYFLHRVIDVEVAIRYPDLQDVAFDDLLVAYSALDTNTYIFLHQRERWNQLLLLNWIDEQQIDLDTTAYFAYKDYDVQVTRRDFGSDGEHEWLLDVWSPIYTQFVVMSHDGQAYYIVPSPLPFYSADAGSPLTASGFSKEQLFADLNGDGLPEWVLAQGGYGVDNLNFGRLIILNWRDEQLVNIAPNYPDDMSYDAPSGCCLPLFPYGVRVDYGDDGEISISQIQNDNWGCSWTLHRVFGWNGAEYTLSRTDRDENDVRGCQVRAAEEVMWAGDVQAAIGHYERAFTLPPDKETWFVHQVELDRYTTARLALAYSLTGRHDNAASTIRWLFPRQDDPPALAALISGVSDHVGDASAVCRAAYDAFTFDCSTSQDACLGSPMNTIVGYTIENFGDDPSSPRHGFPSASRAGCDLTILERDESPSLPLVESTPTIIQPVPPSLIDYSDQPSEALRDVVESIQANEFQQALDILEVTLLNASLDPDVHLALLYLRGITLEFSNRPNDALAQYIQLYELSSDSTWGMLARIHLNTAK